MDDMTVLGRVIDNYPALRAAIVRHDDLSDWILREIDLSQDDVSIRETNFSRCDFRRTNMAKAKFRYCNFTDADFRSAILDHAMFDNCNFEGAIFRAAEVDTAQFTYCTGLVDAGIDWRGYRFVGVKHHAGWRIKAGCRWYTLEEARDHWESRGNIDALRRLDVIRQSGAQNDWIA